MYILFGIIIMICIICACLQFYRRKQAACKVRRIDKCEKICLLNQALSPFGFFYCEEQDIITSTRNAWQRNFGYCSLFDHTAASFGMSFDCEPIFFYYRGCTYRIELWKGQYGINIGAEAGIYYTDSIIAPEQFDTAHFQCVPDTGLLKMELSLFYKGQNLFDHSQIHWWLTGFCMGKFCDPQDLTLWFSITFPNREMLACFIDSLMYIGYKHYDIMLCGLTVSFLFCRPYTKQPRLTHRIKTSCTQRRNKAFVKLFLFFTRPFTCTADRLLYLYFFLPSCFRHMFLCKKNRRQNYRKCIKGGACR